MLNCFERSFRAATGRERYRDGRWHSAISQRSLPVAAQFCGRSTALAGARPCNGGVQLVGRDMTIDERLEKLTERHEALTQSVELLRIAQEETDRRFKRVADLFVQTDGFINDLARIARSHEDRLDNLERHN